MKNLVVRLFTQKDKDIDEESIASEAITKFSDCWVLSSKEIADYWKIPEYRVITIEFTGDGNVDSIKTSSILGGPWISDIQEDFNSFVSIDGKTVFFNPNIRWANIEIY